MSIHTKAALNTVLSFFLAMLLFGIILAISNKHNKTYDATQNKRLSLSEQSAKLVSELKKPVRVVAFTNDHERKDVERILKNYLNANPAMFHFEVLDLLKNPARAKAYDIVYSGQGVLELLPEGGANEPSKRQERLNDFEEQTITNALVKLSDRDSLKLGFLTGHGEASITENQPFGISGLKMALEPEAYKAEEINLAKQPQLPNDLAALIVAGPKAPLLDGERDILKKYIDGGGRLLFWFDAQTDRSYADFLLQYGFEIPDEIILTPDQVGRITQDSAAVVGMVFDAGHPVTKDQKEFILSLLSHPIKSVNDPARANGYSVKPLVSSTDMTVVVPAAEVLGKKKMAPPKGKGASFPLVTLASKSLSEASPESSPSPSASPSPSSDRREARLAVMGGEVFTNQLLRVVGNRDFSVNLINWLVQEESRITIRPVEEESKPLFLAPGQVRNIVGVQLLLVPMIFLLLGILSAVKRR